MLYNYIQLIANLCSYCLISCSILCTSTVIKADLCISRHNPVRALIGLLIGCFQSCVPMMWESQKGPGSEEQELSDICNGGNFWCLPFSSETGGRTGNYGTSQLQSGQDGRTQDPTSQVEIPPKDVISSDISYFQLAQSKLPISNRLNHEHAKDRNN